MLTYLCGICAALFFGSYLSGWLPLAFSLSEARMKRIAVLGAGLLVGTALSVIIPEGLYAVYSAQTAKSQQKELGHSEHEAGEPQLSNVVNKNNGNQELGHGHGHEHDHGHEHEAGGDLHSHGEGHAIVGFVLVCGFVFMLIIDQLSGGHSHNHSHGPPASVNASVSASQVNPIAIAIPSGPSGGSQSGVASARKNQKLTATLGLVVHACADGLAMGAALSAHSRQLEMLVFFAIMLHKSPEAFGLVTFLLHEGFERRRIMRHLFIVSVTAPLFALLTYSVVALSFNTDSSAGPSPSASIATGLALLFSAGTFLYVATVHVLPEILHDMASSASATHSHSLVGRIDLLIVLAGAFLPALLTSHLAH